MSEHGRPRGTLINLIRAIIGDVQGAKFTIKDIDKGLERRSEKVPRGSLKAVLAKLADNGETELVEKGAGRRPTVYRKIALAASSE